MANELPNAVALMGDSEFREWVKAATCYQARVVIANSNAPAAAKAMAVETLMDPLINLNRWVNILAADPMICSKGSTIAQITQATLLAQISSSWQAVSAVIHPEAV